MSVCVSAGDCARQLVKALEAKAAGAIHHGPGGQRVGVPLHVPMDLFREDNGNTWAVLEVPGAKRDTIQVHLNEDQSLLTICGFIEKPNPLQKQGDFIHREGMYGHFIREVQVPRETKEGQIRAKYDNGLLLVEIPDTKAYRAAVEAKKSGAGPARPLRSQAAVDPATGATRAEGEEEAYETDSEDEAAATQADEEEAEDMVVEE